MRITGNEAPIKLMWNNQIGDGWILFSEEFHTLPDITKLDMLKDFIHELEKEYSEQLDIVFEDSEEL